MPKARKLKSGSWRCQVYDHTEMIVQKDGSVKKKLIRKSFTVDDPSPAGKRKCEHMAAKWADDKQRHKHDTDLTIKEAVEKYIDSRRATLSPTTISCYKTIMRSQIDDIAEIKLSKITPEKIQVWVDHLSVGHASKTVHNAHGLISAVLKDYCDGMTVSTRLPAKRQEPLYTPSDDDIKILLESIKGTELEIAVLLGAFGAMRRGEICALTSDDIDGNIVHIRKAVVRGPDGPVVKSPKTPSSYRDVELPDFVIDRIKDKDGKIVDISLDNVTYLFHKAVRDAGLTPFRFHDLRHYSVSIMHAIGIPDQYIMQRGGWKTDSVMKSVYRNTINTETERFSKQINEHFESISHDISHEN